MEYIYTSWANNSRILKVSTVVHVDSIVRTVKQVGLSASTGNVVKNNISSSLSECSPLWSTDSCEHAWSQAITACGFMRYKIGHLYKIPEPYPSCAHTTSPSFVSQRSSQTVPQALLLHTSTRPSNIVLPPTRRMLLSVQLWANQLKQLYSHVIVT